ncbi:transmembrane protein 62-like isoform X2 [Pseudomyrmex gracilis]|uniref:transmembrane protein 62-like isoform X2 n=1 Tax=Pseudomyrmex gracilis TaxID=219809 RepID=UPI000995B407|nr:transmembrane protein 62-like isoform X2 [Pseudomyrmex gracilis]
MFFLMFRSYRLNVVTMRIAKSTIVLLTFVLMLSILVANVADFINVESYPSYETFRDNNGMAQSSDSKYPKYYNIGRSYDRLMWFLQISDLHLSVFKDVSRILELQEFCNVTVDSIRPAVVVASGDLTDAIASDRLGSKQILPEWRSYKYVMEVTNIKEKTLWLDVRGNHDNFNMISLDSKHNYYSNYSIQGKKHPRSYMYNVNVGSETYSFIAVDACLKPGPKRPFNFIGVLDQHEIDKIKQLIKQSKESKADHAIVFGHYPTSCIVSRADTDIRSLLSSYRENMAYLCGHYHTFGGTMPNMYTLQKGGFLELELADWKDNRMYRLAAIDHGQFSFIDIKHNDWPVVLITNPKNAQSRMPQKENPKSVITSTHVRVLAFSTVPIKSVEIQFDNQCDWLQCDHVKGPLYVLPWNSTEYTEGIHHITARVIDMKNREKIVSHDFSLDGSFLSFRILPKLILMYSVVHIFQIAFFILLAIMIVPLCLLRFIHMYRKRRRMYRPRIRNRFLHWVVRKLWVLSTVDKVFFTLMLYSLNMAIGPWSVGEVIDGHIGAIFVWGIYVENSYLPGGITYFYGYIHLVIFNFLLTIILAVQADHCKKLNIPRDNACRNSVWFAAPCQFVYYFLCKSCGPIFSIWNTVY